MSRLLLARAARLLGWPPDSWRDGWPDLLTAAEIATLESCDDSGKPDPGTRAAVLALFETCPPAPGGQSPDAQSGPRLGSPQVFADGYKPGLSIMTGGYHDPWDGWKPARTVECSPLPAYRAETYRQWAARDWPPAPMVAAWLGQDEAAAVPQGEHKPEPAKPEPRQTEINRWLRNTWEAEGRPEGTDFFRLLKKYKRQPGSPIREWWEAGEKAGIEYETSAGARKEWAVKTLQNKISKWKQTATPNKP